MLNRTLESYSIAHDPDFIPHELLHLAHQLFQAGVDRPIRISYARLAPGLSWPAPKLVAHFPAGAGAKDETLKHGIAGQAIRAMRTRCCDLARCIQCRQTGPALQVCSHAAHGIVRCWADGDEIGSDIDVVLKASRVDTRETRLHVRRLQMCEVEIDDWILRRADL